MEDHTCPMFIPSRELLILDGKTMYQIGASLKDAGKKCFAVSEMKDAGRSLMKKLAGI